jgi:hypothetical protein
MAAADLLLCSVLDPLSRGIESTIQTKLNPHRAVFFEIRCNYRVQLGENLFCHERILKALDRAEELQVCEQRYVKKM